jgi:LysR family transcriptional regulator, nod-box dependent transcriptional activator
MQYSNFDTNLLRTLDALLTERSVTRAAERICISQPAMSGALQRLRDHFMDQLLIRAGRDMVLTPLAQSLVAPVRETLLQIQLTLATRPTFDPLTTRRDFNLAMSDYGAFVLMSSLLSRLAVEAPFITCHVMPMCGATTSRLETGDLDMLVTVDNCELVARQAGACDLKMRKLHTDDFVCLVDAHHPLIGETLTIEDYERLPHILVRFGLNLDTLVEQSWNHAGLDCTILATVPSFSSLLFMLPGTQMVATVQRRLADRLAPSLGLRVLECPVDVGWLQQVLMWHPRSDSDPGHQFMREMFAKAALPILRKRELPSREGLIQNLSQKHRPERVPTPL